MLKRLGGAAIVAALSLMFITPASAQFGRLGRAIKNVAKEAVIGAQPAGQASNSGTSSSNSQDSNVALTQLPEQFRMPNPPISDPELSEANIKMLIERDLGGIAKVKKLALEREPGPMWTARKTSDGEILSMWASLFVHAYAELKDGSCAVFMTGFLIEKPSLGFGIGFGEIQAGDNGGKSYLKQPCNLN